MTAAALVRKYGALAPDIEYLREIGHLVAPFKGDWRIDAEVVDGETLAARAETERQRRRPRVEARKVEAPVPKIEELAPCACGQPASHRGMCSVRWAKRRANNGPSGNRAAPPPAPAPPEEPATELIAARVRQLEQDMEHLFAVVADALRCRQETLIDQAKGLAEIEARLRQPA